MPHISSDMAEVITTVVIVISALAVIFIRLQAAKKPTSIKKIIIPPIGMSTGFLMFLFPMFRIPWSYALLAFLVGTVFSYPLVITSRMERVNDRVYLKRSPTFILVLLILLILRLVLHSYIERFVTIPETGGIFFILAFGMIAPWRVAMYLRFKRFVAD